MRLLYSFADFGLSHILLHFSPVSLSLSSLQSLPFSSKIPSLSPSSSLYITSNNDLQVSINNVKVVGSPIYDDRFVVVFGYAENFTGPDTNRNPNFNPTTQCISFDPFSWFYEVPLLLKPKGYLVMSSFFEFQLIENLKSSSPWLRLTPMDDAIVGFSGDFPEYQQLSLSPSVLYWTGLIDMVNGTAFKKYVNGFSLKIAKVNDVSFVNGVEITYPDLYYNDWLVVHGLQSLIPSDDMVAVSVAPNLSEF